MWMVRIAVNRNGSVNRRRQRKRGILPLAGALRLAGAVPGAPPVAGGPEAGAAIARVLRLRTALMLWPWIESAEDGRARRGRLGQPQVHLRATRREREPDMPGPGENARFMWLGSIQPEKWGERISLMSLICRRLESNPFWHGMRTLTVLVVYASTGSAENKAFWDTITDIWLKENLPVPDSVLGDLNVVEGSIGRFPHRLDEDGATGALARFKRLLELKDG
ncbi:hypothetical protein DFH09DRAFT_1284243 [Mycena vulgaris]|nr:hypothetical protein DFH09DRAFT_1284243 [Mycena vulgaris]